MKLLGENKKKYSVLYGIIALLSDRQAFLSKILHLFC